MTNSSTSNCRSLRVFLTAMAAAKLVGLCAKLDPLREHRIITVPLHEIGSAHESAVFRCSPVIVPEVEIDEVDGLREWRGVQHTLLPERRNEIGRLLDL